MNLHAALFLLGVVITLNAQTKSNYDIILEMMPESVSEVAYASGNEETGIVVNLPAGGSILSNRVLSSAVEINKKIISGTFDDKKNIIYTLENIEVLYGELFHQGFPGDYYCERTIKLGGVNILKSGAGIESYPFDISRKDTVEYDSIKELEQGASFTRGEKPEEPFFRSIIEPVIAVTAAIVTVYLLFDVRSK
ncbi:MAG: hypothetical protein SCALA702_18360 [Melioribacteraceae bacterium]|nr:MAG: hypothetical protein SCALA702_18360 [Melioribacteraceae bacterium]